MINTNEEKEEQSRMSFVTVTSLIDDIYDNKKFKHTADKNFVNVKEENNITIENHDDKMNYKNDLLSESKDKFEDLPLQFDSKDNSKKKNINPYLLVEDKGEKRDYLGTYKNYEISEINEKKEKKILCFRRYDNFDNFYKKLKKKYPFFLIPKLIGKNPFTKIINIDNEFYNKRRRQLNYFINILSKHPHLKKTREFIKFINDPDFDEEYFKKEENLYYFPESSKNTETFKNKIYGIFSNISNYFKANEDILVPTEQEKINKRMEVFYKNMFDNMKEIKSHLSIYVFNIKKSYESYLELSDNFLYLKDVTFDHQNTKEIFFNFNEICQDLSAVNKKYFEEMGIILEDKFEGFISVLNGLCDTFDRYNEFLKYFHLVHKALNDSKINTRNYDIVRLNQEVKSVNELKQAFEKYLNEEINNFVRDYSFEYLNILESYKLLIRLINTNELETMQKHVNYFK